MSSDQQHFECNEPSVIFERFDDETILINLDSGQYYSLDPIAAAVWHLIGAGNGIDGVVARIAEHYGDAEGNVSGPVRDLVETMLSESLLRARTDASAGVEAIALDPPEAGGFSPPQISKYNDMQEMLLLDPVHDVDDTGWPAAAQPDVRVEADDAASWPSADEED